jgi:nitronate monooxygenase
VQWPHEQIRLGEIFMFPIDRRELLKRATLGTLACSAAAAANLRTNQANAQSTTLSKGAWPNRRLVDLLQVEHPIIQAPMGGHAGVDMVVAVAGAGGVGSLPTAWSTPNQIRDDVAKIRSTLRRPINLNFFCHAAPKRNEATETAWRQLLASYYAELGVPAPGIPRIQGPFDGEKCDVVVEIKPEIVSFHFGLPEASLLKRVKAAGCVVLGSATTVAEARWLEDHGADAVIAQGAEAGGHRGMFLATEVACQVGTLALVPQVADAVKVPVIAAGGIADGRGIAAAFALGASGVQCGTAYLFCPEATLSRLHRAALRTAREDETAITTIFTGRPARSIVNRAVRELGFLPEGMPQFPLASGDMRALMVKAETQGSSAFTALWSGQAVTLCQELPARDLTQKLAAQALARLNTLGHATAG